MNTNTNTDAPSKEHVAQLASLVLEVAGKNEALKEMVEYCGYVAEVARCHDRVKAAPRGTHDRVNAYREAAKAYDRARCWQARRPLLPHPNEVLKQMGYDHAALR